MSALTTERFNVLLAVRAGKRAEEAVHDAVECAETARLADAASLADEAIYSLGLMKEALAKAQGRTQGTG